MLNLGINKSYTNKKLKSLDKSFKTYLFRFGHKGLKLSQHSSLEKYQSFF